MVHPKKFIRLCNTALRAAAALVVITLFSGLAFPCMPGAEMLERIVAIVNKEIILLSEYEDSLRAAEQSGSSASPEQVMDELVNRKLILQEARRLRIVDPDRYAPDEEEISAAVEEYIDRRIKAFIHVPFQDIEHYYRMNREQFPDSDLFGARDRIEEILASRELESRISSHVKELRNKAYVRIQLEDSRQ